MISRDQNIVITGFMATGKSTVAPIVAERLNRQFVEMDTEIERQAGNTIPEIFQHYGEQHFRELERALTIKLARMQNLVVATGGGTLIDDENRSIMLNKCFVVCLMTTSDVLESRLTDVEARPLAVNWQRLWKMRQIHYREIPYQIDVTDKSPETVVKEIVDLWQQESQ